MVWHQTAPDGTRSVKANGPLLLDNTAYVEATMGPTANDTTNTDVIRDHYWNVSANLDGRHRFVNMPEYTIAGAVADPVLGASMGGTYYCKKKTVAEAPAQQDVQPFFRNAAADVMQLIGMRACCTFEGRTTNGACTLQYSHNVTSVTRTGIGQYDIVMTNDLPSVNYLMNGSGIRVSTTFYNQVIFNFRAPVTLLSEVKTVNSMKLITVRIDNVLKDVIQGWFCCYGG